MPALLRRPLAIASLPLLALLCCAIAADSSRAAAPPPPVPAEACVKAGDPAAKIQQALDRFGFVYLERGGDWKASASVRRNSAVPGLRPGVFGYGRPGAPAPVLRGPRGGAAVSVAGKGLKGVAVEGVTLLPDGPHDRGRSHGVHVTAAVDGLSLRDVTVRRFNQNVVIDGPVRGLVIDRLVSTHARGAPGDSYSGQGLFLNKCLDTPRVFNSVLWHNGADDDVKDADWNIYRHGTYDQKGSKAPLFTDCVIGRNVACGAQGRDGAGFKTCFFYDNGCSVYAVGGGVTMEGCAVLGGHRYFTPAAAAKPGQARRPGSWIGNVAVSTCTTLNLSDVIVVGLPGQAMPDADKGPDGRPARSFDMGCFQVSRQYGPKPAWSDGGKLGTWANVLVADWPGALFSGDAAGDARCVPPAKAAAVKRVRVARPELLAEVGRVAAAAGDGDPSATAARLIKLTRQATLGTD